MMQNLWICNINKMGFIVFNDQLEHTRYFDCTKNKINQMLFHQRREQIVTIRQDRKQIKFWTAERVVETTKNKDKGDGASGKKKEDKADGKDDEAKAKEDKKDSYMKGKRYQSFLKSKRVQGRKVAFEEEKESFIKNKKTYSFDLNILSVNQMTMHRSLIVDVIIHEDLDYLVISHDIGEITIYECQHNTPVETINPMQIKEHGMWSKLPSNPSFFREG